MRTLLLYFVLGTLLTSCKSFHLSSVSTGTSLSNKLPPLVPELDRQSFQTDYADLYSIPGKIITGSANPETVLHDMTTTMIISQDTEHLFERELIRNISQKTGRNAGYAVCRKGIRTRGMKSFVNPLVSIVTLGIPNLFGFKYATLVDELELVVDIYDNDNNVVASFSAFGRGEADMKLYKGYNKRGARRLAHANAFSYALQDIKSQIVEEYDALNIALTD